MKNTKLIKLLPLLAISLFFITSCEDEKGLTNSDMETSQGFIEVALNGEAENGEFLEDESFKATKFGKGNEEYNNSIEKKNDSIYNIRIQRTDNTITWNNYAYLNIKYNVNQDFAEIRSFETKYTKELDDQTVLKLYFDKNWFGNNDGNIKEINTFEFDEETFELSGKVSISYTYENDNTINANVEFEAQPKKFVN